MKIGDRYIVRCIKDTTTGPTRFGLSGQYRAGQYVSTRWTLIATDDIDEAKIYVKSDSPESYSDCVSVLFETDWEEYFELVPIAISEKNPNPKPNPEPDSPDSPDSETYIVALENGVVGRNYIVVQANSPEEARIKAVYDTSRFTIRGVWTHKEYTDYYGALAIDPEK